MLELLLTLGTLALDQLTKIWAAGPLATTLGGSVPVIPGVFHLTYVENRGMAFGLLQNKQTFFIIMTLAVSAVFVYLLVTKRKSMNLWIRLALALILSGAVGNLIDRAVLGYVRDMLDFCLINFPVFNVADSCICIGAVLLIVGTFLLEKQEKEKKKKAAEAVGAEKAGEEQTVREAGQPEEGAGEAQEQETAQATAQEETAKEPETK